MILRRAPFRRVIIGKTSVGSTPFYITHLRSGPFGNSVVFPGSAINSLTLTICNTQTGVIINNRDNVDFFASGGTVDENGLLTFPLLSADTSLIDTPGLTRIMRSLIFNGTYEIGQKVFRWEDKFIVTELSDELDDFAA
jgi:hypothetical protein